MRRQKGLRAKRILFFTLILSLVPATALGQSPSLYQQFRADLARDLGIEKKADPATEEARREAKYQELKTRLAQDLGVEGAAQPSPKPSDTTVKKDSASLTAGVNKEGKKEVFSYETEDMTLAEARKNLFDFQIRVEGSGSNRVVYMEGLALDECLNKAHTDGGYFTATSTAMNPEVWVQNKATGAKTIGFAIYDKDAKYRRCMSEISPERRKCLYGCTPISVAIDLSTIDEDVSVSYLYEHPNKMTRYEVESLAEEITHKSRATRRSIARQTAEDRRANEIKRLENQVSCRTGGTWFNDAIEAAKTLELTPEDNSVKKEGLSAVLARINEEYISDLGRQAAVAPVTELDKIRAKLMAVATSNPEKHDELLEPLRTVLHRKLEAEKGSDKELNAWSKTGKELNNLAKALPNLSKENKARLVSKVTPFGVTLGEDQLGIQYGITDLLKNNGGAGNPVFWSNWQVLYAASQRRMTQACNLSAGDLGACSSAMNTFQRVSQMGPEAVQLYVSQQQQQAQMQQQMSQMQMSLQQQMTQAQMGLMNPGGNAFGQPNQPNPGFQQPGTYQNPGLPPLNSGMPARPGNLPALPQGPHMLAGQHGGIPASVQGLPGVNNGGSFFAGGQGNPFAGSSIVNAPGVQWI